MRVLAIDPGPVESAWLIYDNGRITHFGKDANARVRDILTLNNYEATHVAIEMIASYGMAVGREVFETCLQIGRMIEIEPNATLVFRKDVKLHLCNSSRANDTNIRVALIDRFGPPGTKKSPGATYGISKDVWSALAIAVTFADQRE